MPTISEKSDREILSTICACAQRRNVHIERRDVADFLRAVADDDADAYVVEFFARRRLGVFDVVVGNIGTVASFIGRDRAHSVFDAYVVMSRDDNGRCAGESVTLMDDGEPVKEYEPQEPNEDETGADGTIECFLTGEPMKGNER